MRNNSIRKETVSLPFYIGQSYVSDDRKLLASLGNMAVDETYEPVYQLCGYRHDNPITKGLHVFPSVIENPMDVYGLEQYAKAFLLANGFGVTGKHTLYVVVTGLTTALVALLNACIDMRDTNASYINVCLLHWDKNTMAYCKQWVYK